MNKIIGKRYNKRMQMLKSLTNLLISWINLKTKTDSMKMGLNGKRKNLMILLK